LDIVAVSVSYLMLIPGLGNYSGVRAFRTLRTIRVIGSGTGNAIASLLSLIFPLGLKVAVSAAFSSVSNLLNVLTVNIFFLCFFTLVGVQLYAGVLRQRCTANGGKIMPSVP
jgi:hypothetical protein